jgi:ATP-dependent RNA helicase RhlE
MARRRRNVGRWCFRRVVGAVHPSHPSLLPKVIVVNAFTELPLLPGLQATLAELQLVTPTEIQRRALPLLLEGRSVVGVAETGSGKTLAYALPILHVLKTLEHGGSRVEEGGRPRAVVMVPTRELGEQVAKAFKPFTHTTRLRVRTVLGGTDIDVAKKNIAGPFEVLVATPGRVGKLLERGLLRFDDVRVLVFDEADQMLDQGFLPDATKIAAACPPARQLALFSATVSQTVQQLIQQLFDNAEVIRSQRSHQVPSTLRTIHRTVENGDRLSHLRQLLHERVVGGTMLFANTREQCDALAAQIEALGHTAVVYRGEMDKVERRRNLQAFRDGTVELLVATDLAGRGLDVAHVARVINVHLPRDLENYLHRVGRTARAGRAGVVVNLVTARDAPLLAAIEGLTQGRQSPLPAKTAHPPKPPKPTPPRRTSKTAATQAKAGPPRPPRPSSSSKATSARRGAGR